MLLADRSSPEEQVHSESHEFSFLPAGGRRFSTAIGDAGIASGDTTSPAQWVVTDLYPCPYGRPAIAACDIARSKERTKSSSQFLRRCRSSVPLDQAQGDFQIEQVEFRPGAGKEMQEKRFIIFSGRTNGH